MAITALRALRSRNFRLFVAGQSVSLIGTWMTRLATSWLIYRLTQSPLLLGVASFAGQIPLFFLAPVAGVLVDRWDRHRALIVTQVASLVQSLALAALVFSGRATEANVIALMLLQGFVNAFDMPVRQAFVVQMVDSRDDLPNAIALNSSMVNMARLVGPAIAGAVIGIAGEGWCFLADGISYGAVIVSLLLMHVRPLAAPLQRKKMLAELSEGWNYVTRSVPIRSILLLLALISLLGTPYMVLMPIFAAKVLHGGPHTLGWLMGATGVGALAGALSLAGRPSVLGLGRIIPLSAGIFGAALVVFGLSTNLWLSLAVLLFTGFGMMRHMAASNTILQTILEENKRGRVMSFYSMAFAGMAPFGSLLAGFVADRIGSPYTVVISGALCVAGAVWFAASLPALREAVRPIYIGLGILPGGEGNLQPDVLQETAERR